MEDLAFRSGLPGLDLILQGLRPGDNVVLKIGTVDDYRPLVEPFLQQSLSQCRAFIYFRFARHAPLIAAQSGVRIHELDPATGFERFISEILDVVEATGRGACYVFDCLSDLAVDWYSERMLGNFFMIACPYLFQLDTVAYFALIRDRHSPLAVYAITDTAQVVLDIYQGNHRFFVHPLKVEGRFSRNMYDLHQWDRAAGTFNPVRSSAVMSEILGDTASTWLEFTAQRPDVWSETFLQAKSVVDQGAGASDLAAAGGTLAGHGQIRMLHDRLLRMAITRQDKFIELARQYFSLSDLLAVIKRMVGTGLIGGKSLGMLLARAVLVKTRPRWRSRLEAHDSFFIGSDVFYTFLVGNQCWWPRRRRTGESLASYLERAVKVRKKIRAGVFPADILGQFEEMLNYFGQSPIIVRSSSLQEDSYGNAFSGKYESVFCANQGHPRHRLASFLRAVRQVYASTMSREALLYRHDRGLLEEDEQMALLVQRVSGDALDNWFFPALAGTGYSYNSYAWGPGVKAEAGMLRLVMGLGTRAVDRTEDDYTRLVALNAPWLRPPAHAGEAERYRQRRVDVIDLANNRFATVPVEQAVSLLSPASIDKLTFLDWEMTRRRAREHQVKPVVPRKLDFEGVLQGPLPVELREMLQALETAYGAPVDIEFTVNFADEQHYLINLVQCRPFQVRMEMPARLGQMVASSEQLILKTAGPVIGQAVATAVDEIVFIKPAAYSRLGEQDRYELARLLGRLTHRAESRDRRIMLIGPGRWGTSSPSLGVPVSFSEINTVKILCEVAVMHEGLVPDISLGTHFFNDLVEMNMLYLAVFPESANNQFNSELLLAQVNRLPQALPGIERWQDIVHLVQAGQETGLAIQLHADTAGQQAACWLKSAGGPGDSVNRAGTAGDS